MWCVPRLSSRISVFRIRWTYAYWHYNWDMLAIYNGWLEMLKIMLQWWILCKVLYAVLLNRVGSLIIQIGFSLKSNSCWNVNLWRFSVLCWRCLLAHKQIPDRPRKCFNSRLGWNGWSSLLDCSLELWTSFWRYGWLFLYHKKLWWIEHWKNRIFRSILIYIICYFI